MGVAHHNPSPSRRRFAEIVRRHQTGVCAAAYGVTGDRALSEDIAQDTFLVAWRTLPTLRDPSKLGEWLRGIARNLARKARRRRTMAALDDCGELAAGDDPSRDAVAQDEAHLAWAALRDLPARYREALVLYYWEEQSARRVAASLGITEATAMQRLSRGRALLRDEILRRVEGTLRRARPGAALTAAILAAVTAATARTAAAATGNAATAHAATGSAATTNAATTSAATGSAATTKAATASAATASAATTHAATGSAETAHAATASAATGSAATAHAATGSVATTTAAATSAATGSAATGGARSPASGLSRRVIWKAGLTLVGLGALAPIAAWSGRRRASGAAGPAREPSTAARRSGDTSSTALRHDAQGRSSTIAAGRRDPSRPPEPSDAPEPRVADDDRASYGDPMSPTITSSDLPAKALGPLSAALSLCFVDELVDRPCRIEVEVRGGKIAATRVEPFDGASRRVVVRTLQDAPVALEPAALIAWLAADKLISAVRDEPQLADRDQAMAVGTFVALCAKARVEGLTVGGPDGTHHLRFGWVRDVSRPVDRQAYVDLCVATGASLGPAGAPVTVVSFLDLAGAWGFARKSLAAWREVLALYPRDVRLVVKLCPLGPEHELVAEAVHAAGAQGVWWPMLEQVAANPEHQTLDDLVRHSASLGLDTAQLRDDLARRTFRDALDLDRDQMAAMDIVGVPSALVNCRRVHGAVPAATCAAAVEDSLRSLARRTGTESPG